MTLETPPLPKNYLPSVTISALNCVSTAVWRAMFSLANIVLITLATLGFPLRYSQLTSM